MTIPCANPLVSPDPVGPGLPAGAALPAATAGRKSSVPAACGGRSRRRRRAGALALGVLLAAGAMAAERFPITPAQRDEADKIARQGVAIADLAPNAPASYTIKRGDTLWGISSLFLKSPWRWPELWGMNRTQIHNPHLIYPGQTLLLVKTADGRAQLVLAGSAPPAPEAPVAAPAVAPTPPPPPTEKLSPRARDMGSAAEVMAISSIPNNQIEPFLSRPKVVTPEELAGFPRIVATQQDRVYLGAGDIAYARGIDSAAHDGAENFHVFRPASALYDPDDYDRNRSSVCTLRRSTAVGTTHRLWTARSPYPIPASGASGSCYKGPMPRIDDLPQRDPVTAAALQSHFGAPTVRQLKDVSVAEFQR